MSKTKKQNKKSQGRNDKQCSECQLSAVIEATCTPGSPKFDGYVALAFIYTDAILTDPLKETRWTGKERQVIARAIVEYCRGTALMICEDALEAGEDFPSRDSVIDLLAENLTAHAPGDLCHTVAEALVAAALDGRLVAAVQYRGVMPGRYASEGV